VGGTCRWSFGGPRALSTQSTAIVFYRARGSQIKTDNLSRDVPPHLMATLTDEQRRALQLLARSPSGCTEALLMAHGFEVAMLSRLAVAVDHSTTAGRRRMKVTWLRITNAGRKAIAG
jgi:hypothetical protein